jgi:hypothetical protein
MLDLIIQLIRKVCILEILILENFYFALPLIGIEMDISMFKNLNFCSSTFLDQQTHLSTCLPHTRRSELLRK